MKNKVVVIDKTGRGHSICTALASAKTNATIYYVPGTSGVFEPNIIPVPGICITDVNAIDSFCKEIQPDFIFVSHISALTAGVADQLRSSGFSVFGVSKSATKCESSKFFCKEICAEMGISTSVAKMVLNRKSLREILNDQSQRPFMIKADGLTLNGNGAIAVLSEDQTADVLHEVDLILAQNPQLPFSFLVEEFQEGTDYSVHYFVNRGSIVRLPSSQDFKKSHANDLGANCDGMGSISPHPLDNQYLNERIENLILIPYPCGIKEKAYRVHWANLPRVAHRLSGTATPAGN